MNEDTYNHLNGFERVAANIPDEFVWQYHVFLRAKRPEHIWILSNGGNAIHVSARTSEWNHRFEWSGGIECHWSVAPEWVKESEPHHEHCWILGGPCWHDGSSLYFSDNIAPMLPDLPAPMEQLHHDYVLHEMRSWFRSHFEKDPAQQERTAL